VIAVRLFAEYFMKQIRGAINYQMLLFEIRRGIDAAKNFDHPQPVQRAVLVPDGLQNFDSAFACCATALFGC